MKKACFIVLSLFLLAGTFGMVPTASATSYDPTGPAGNPPFPTPYSLIWNHGQKGDALFGEYYRIVQSPNLQDPFAFATYISIENTTNRWVAAHVRLRSGRYSVEVIDFPILLSPYDVFWFQLQLEPTGPGGSLVPILFSGDADTLTQSDLPSPEWRVNLYANPANLLPKFTKSAFTDPEELTQGYVEVFGLWALPGSTAAGYKYHNINSRLWSDSNGFTTFPAIRTGDLPGDFIEAQDLSKALTGHVFVGDFTNGLYFGYPMNAIKDFRSDNPEYRHRDLDARIWYDPSIPPPPFAYLRGPNNGGGKPIKGGTILYQNIPDDPAYGDPDWATSFGPTWNDADDQNGRGIFPVDSWGLDDVDDALVKQRIDSTFFNTGFSGETYTLLAVTAPTKYLHYFFDQFSGLVTNDGGSSIPIFQFISPGRGEWQVNYAQANTVRGQINLDFYMGNMSAKFAAWNLFQKGIGEITSPYLEVVLPWEVNFIAIGNKSYEKLAPFCFLEIGGPLTNFDLPFASTPPANNPAAFNAGWFSLAGFELGGGVGLNDPRTDEFLGTFQLFPAIGVLPPCLGGYDRRDFPLLGTYFNQDIYYIIPVSARVMDFEFTNFSHARAFTPAWDNTIIPCPYFPSIWPPCLYDVDPDRACFRF